MSVPPDVEAEIVFTDDRTHSNGFRPTHKLENGYLTTGMHQYYKNVGSQHRMGTITFITPEAYPHSMQIGSVLPLYDGNKQIGYATITKIFNYILAKQKNKLITSIFWVKN